jgi:predicted nucleic acid-binding protein
MTPTLLDTDIVSELVRRNPTVSQRAEAYGRLWGPLKLSVITYYEALSGLLYRDARLQLSRLESIAALSDILPVTAEAAAISARIEADLRSRGLGIGATDTLIAGVALTNGLVLATNNTRHYERIEGLQLVNWTT